MSTTEHTAPDVTELHHIQQLTATIRPTLEAVRKAVEDGHQSMVEAVAGLTQADYTDAQAVVLTTVNGLPAFDSALSRIATDPNLSAQGKAAAKAAEGAKLAANLEAMEARAKAAADAIRAKAPSPNFGVDPRPHSKDAVLLEWARFQHVPPRSIIEGAADTLRTARDPKATPEEKLDANYRLKEYYGPALSRISEAPPRHARGFQDLATEIASALSTHLDAEFGGPQRRTMSALADQLEAEARSVSQLIRKGGADKFVLKIAAPHLLGDQ